MTKQTVRTTLNLPTDLLAATDRAIKQGKAKSRNALIAQAIRHELEALNRAKIEVELAEMAQDPDYQSEVLRMEAEFSPASWEAFQLGEEF